MGVLDTGAHLEEEAQFLLFGEGGGELCAGFALHELHQKVAEAERGGAGVNETGDVLVLQRGENLGFAVLKRSVGLQEDDFDGDVFLEIAAGTFAFVNNTHATATDLFVGFVRAEGLPAEVEHRGLEEIALLLVGVEEIFDLETGVGFGPALLPQPAQSGGWREFERLVKEAFDAVPRMASRHGNRITNRANGES